MESQTIKTIAKIALFVLGYLFLYHLLFYAFIKPVPWEGDSIDYHIPIAERLSKGDPFYIDAVRPQQYYPGASDALLIPFMKTGIPLNIYNLAGIVCMFLAALFLARNFNLKPYYSLIFAASICTLNMVIRWLGAQTIDIWLAAFFMLSLALLNKPAGTFRNALFLGISLGMVVGSKYTGVGFTLILLLFYFRQFLKIISGLKLFIFLVPFILIGLFWYIRNYLLFGNPFYPLPVLFFKGVNIFVQNVLGISTLYPQDMINAVISEAKIWSLSIIIAPLLFIKSLRSTLTGFSDAKKLTIIGIVSLVYYLFFPTSEQPWIMVSSLRYSYPIFITLILSLFIFAQTYRKSELISYIAIGNMILLHPLEYHPKLVMIYIPVVLVLFAILERVNIIQYLKNSK